MKTWVVLWLIIFGLLISISGSGGDRFVQMARADHNSIDSHIARIIITNGGPITVCSEYPNATGSAIALWNDAIKAEGYVSSSQNIFQQYSPPTGTSWLTGCPDTVTPGRISSIIIAKVTRSGTGIRRWCGNEDALGCFFADESIHSESPLFTFENRLRIGIADITYIKARDRQGNVQSYQINLFPLTPVSADNTGHAHHELLKGVIAHELGHTIVLKHALCTAQSIMYRESFHSVCARFSRVQIIIPSMTLSYPGSAQIAAPDLKAYHDAYHPDPVNRDYSHDRVLDIGPHDVPITVSYSSGSFTLTWDASNVHVEHNFVVRRKTGNTWSAPLATVAANGTSATITGAAAVSGTYGVFSTTHADIKHDQHTHPHAALGVVATVKVTIPSTPPANPTPPTTPSNPNPPQPPPSNPVPVPVRPTPSTYTLTVEAGTGGTACCSGTHRSGTIVWIRATAADGYCFKSWSTDNSRLRSAAQGAQGAADSTGYCPKTGRIGVRMIANQVKVASFRPASE